MTFKALDNNNSLAKEKLYVALLAAIQFTHIVDFVVMMPLGPTLMRVMGITPIQFASLVSSYSFSAAAAGVAYGVIADRFDRKKLLVFSFVGFVIGTLSCGLTEDFEVLLTARLIAGCFGGILTGIVFAVVSDLIPFQRRGSALGIIMSAFSIASILGVPIGLAIADAFGWQKAFWFIALFSLPVLFVSKMVFPPMADHIQKSSPLQDLKRFGVMLLKVDYLKPFSVILLLGMSTFMIVPFLAPFAVKNIGILESELKYLYLVGGAITVVTSRFIGKATDKFGAYRMFIIMGVLSFVPIFLYTNAQTMGLVAFLALSSFFMSTISGRVIPLMTMATEISEPQDRGTYMGLLNSIRALGSAIAPLITGAVVIETQSGSLERFPTAGYISIFITICAITLGALVNNTLKKKHHGQNSAD